jgi:hypothetical protein
MPPIPVQALAFRATPQGLIVPESDAESGALILGALHQLYVAHHAPCKGAIKPVDMEAVCQATGLIINDLIIYHEDIFIGIAKMHELAITCQDDTPFLSGQSHDIPIGGTTR